MGRNVERPSLPLAVLRGYREAQKARPDVAPRRRAHDRRSCL